MAEEMTAIETQVSGIIGMGLVVGEQPPAIARRIVAAIAPTEYLFTFVLLLPRFTPLALSFRRFPGVDQLIDAVRGVTRELDDDRVEYTLRTVLTPKAMAGIPARLEIMAKRLDWPSVEMVLPDGLRLTFQRTPMR